MSEHKATVRWKLHADGEAFLKGRYSREHTWTFDGGVTVPASPSPGVVPAPWSNPACVDPEEGYVAAIASCHMLTFLYVAMREGVLVESYEDDAVGVMRKNERGAVWVSAVTLQPRIVYGGDKRPSGQEVERLHHAAHEQCFIANSVKTEITVTPREA
ncbi:MAG TPA: OsmC family protein [Candidatus Binatia bacterium]|nr:OsmC family protein [Candidatus Binatia bacterium]